MGAAQELLNIAWKTVWNSDYQQIYGFRYQNHSISWCGFVMRHSRHPHENGCRRIQCRFLLCAETRTKTCCQKKKRRGAVAELLKRGRGRQGCSCWNGQFWLITFGTKDLTLDYSCKKKMSVFQSPVAEVKLSVQLLTTAPPQRPAVRRRTWTLDAMPR